MYEYMFFDGINMGPNRLAGAIALLACVWKMSISDLGWDTVLSEVFLGFPYPFSLIYTTHSAI
jgi:hypothetical protein